MTAQADVVVYRIDAFDCLESVTRGTLAEVKAFIDAPTWPYEPGEDVFIAVDEWGHGKIVAASPKVTAWVGWSKRQFQLTVTREPQRARTA